jgi:hypothetical protein
MLLGCLGRFRCRARSLGRCVVVVWCPACGCLACCPEPCVSVLVLVFVEVYVWCLFCTGTFVPLLFCLIQRYIALLCVREKKK